MVEWFNTSVLKTEKVNSFQGSNPCLSKKILVSILSIKKKNIKNEIIKIIISSFIYYHIDIMDYSYVNNNSFCKIELCFIIFFLKKFLNLKIEIHLMTKFFNCKNKIKKIFHFENNNKSNNFSIGSNFCWKYIFFFKKKYLIMSVIPGFGNQKFLNKTKNILLKNQNIDGGVNYKIYKLIKNYFNKIIIGSSIVNIKIFKSFFNYNFINNEYLI